MLESEGRSQAGWVGSHHLGTIETGVNTGNCCWGEDGSVLFVMCDTHIARIKTRTQGVKR